MADNPRTSDSGEDINVRPEHESSTGMPRWVKVFLIIAIILALAFVVTRLAGVQHGPGLHSQGPVAARHASSIQRTL
jgi:flagellar biogenesis protein FliO